MKLKPTSSEQFALPFLDTTSLGGFGLYGGHSPAFRPGATQSVDDAVADREERENLSTAASSVQNYRLAGDRNLAATWKGRVLHNLAAIRLASLIETEGRAARPDEQERLARFTAFGASDVADRLFRRAGDEFSPAWEELGLELEQLASRDDLASLKRATQYAHFTREYIVRVIWRALMRIGFDGGRVLEPGCGTGLFFALAPEALQEKPALTGIEMDRTTARIAKLLYPGAQIRHEDFTKARLPDPFDIAIGNPPFSDRAVRADDESSRLGLSLHDYFIARSVERLRPGGLAAFVTSRWTLDKASEHARRHIAAMADLVGAVRLAEGAMRAAAGTDVVVDILVLQKREPGVAPNGEAWDTLAEVLPAEDGESAISINRYFLDHPEMVLGAHARTSSAYGPTYTCQPVYSTEAALADKLDRALDRLPRGIFLSTAAASKTVPSPVDVKVGTAADGARIKEGSYLIHVGALVQILDGVPQPVKIREGRGRTGSPPNTPASFAASSPSATPSATSFAPRPTTGRMDRRRSGCVRLMGRSSGASGRSI